MQTKMNMKMKRIFSMFLALLMVCSVITVSPKTVYAVSNADSSAAASYGLQDDVQDGVILHCWDWSFNNIKAQMKTIAECGYSAVQTSPIQEAKEPTKGKGNSHWWLFYQPKSFKIDDSGNSGLGTKAEFTAMCEEAHKYGVKVIVDVVANHLGNEKGYDKASGIPDDIKNDNSCWHDQWNKEINYGDRYSITHGSMGGLPDLNTESTKVQGYVLNFLKECIDAGADGFRFDAAKHIGVPSEGSQFWPNTVVKATEYAKSSRGIDLYNYGEILHDTGPGGPAVSEYTQYMSITENDAGNSVAHAVNNGNAGSAASSYYNKGAAANKIVLWAESHDTYSNDSRESTNISNTNIKKGWAMVASRANASALYFARTNGWRVGQIGEIGTWDWKSPEVAAVNKFHNYFHGQSEYLASSGSYAYNERGTSGVIIVNCGGGTSGQVNIKANKMKDGTYKDQVSGNTFTVSNGQISGQIGSTGIAVVYNAAPIVKEPTPTISKEGGEFSGDTLSLTIGLSNATSGTYKIGSGSAQSYSSSKTITIGEDMSYGESVTITLTATDGSKTTTKSYTFKKVEKVIPQGNVAYLALPSGWSTPVKCYAYDSATEKVENAKWPGVEMTLDSDTGYYMYEIPSNIEKPRVIFYSSDTNRHPADMLPGLLFETDGSYLYKDGSWSKYSPTPIKGTVIVKYVDESGKEIATSKTMTGAIGSSYTTSAVEVDGYTLKTTPSNATGKYTSSTITVKYVYKEVPNTDPKVTTSLASGSKFTTETQTITLTLANATSGTYSVDDGPVKTFTNTASVVLGQGKVADSTVTVKATATGSTGTKSFTFTYNKEFNGTVNEQTNAATTYAETGSSQGLASHYATNPSGTGKKATITIDGSFSDWSKDMLIAQGAAWDVANHFKGGHENCVLDTYSLYGAWDDNNLYVAWQMVNTTDTWARSGDGPLSDGGRVLDVPLILALSVDPSSTSMSNKNTKGGPIWGEQMGVQFETHVDNLLYMSGKPGLGKPSLFKAVDAQGNTDYEEGCIGFSTGGIEYKMAEGNICDSIMGLNFSEDPSDVCSDSADWVDFKTFKGSSGTHDTQFDSFYEIKIPLSVLGITKSDLETKGIGAMLVATRGESGLDCIPFDTTMLDNALDSYSADPSTSLEKEDEDVITVPFARIGAGPVPPVPPVPTELELNFGAEKSSPQLADTTLTLKGIAKGGTAPYTYKYSVGSTSLGTKSGSGETSTTWKPTAAGKYLIKCTVTDADGKSVTSAKYYNIEGDVPPVNELQGTLKIDGSTANKTVNVGTTVKLVATATGGSGNYSYKFAVLNKTTGAWSVLKDFSSSALHSYTMNYAGPKEFAVTVKDSTGATVATNRITVTVVDNPTPLVGTLKVDGSTAAKTVAKGTTVKLTASATGGKAGYTYKYAVLNLETGAWSILKDFSSSTSFSYTMNYAGPKEFAVTVKDSTGKTVATNRVKVTVSNVDPLKGTLKVDGSTAAKTVAKGTTVKLTASATGGKAGYTYKYAVLNLENGNWSILKDFSSTTSYSYTMNYAGPKEFAVTVKDSTGKTVATNRVKVTVSNVTPLKGTLKVDGSTAAKTVSKGTTVKLTASATGGKAGYTYKYAVLNVENGKWSILKDFSTATSFSYKMDYTGTKEFAVTVKDANGTTVATNRVTVKVTNAALAGTLKVNSLTTAQTVAQGTTVKLTASATGGSGSYTYKYAVLNKETGKWSILKDFSTTTSFSYKMDYLGEKEFAVTVKDSTGKTVATNRVVVKVATSVPLQAVLTVNGSSSAVKVTPGTQLNLVVTATGGKPGYTYKIALLNSATGTWSILQDFAANNKYTFAIATARTIELTATVKDASGKTVGAQRIKVTIS